MSAFQQNITKNFNKFIDRYGWKGLIAVLFYPVITLVTTPVRLVQTLWNCRVLADGKEWRNYPHFSPHSAINSLFYWTRALNLYRYGRSGKSPTIGLGKYSLNRCFHYSLLSLYGYWKAGTVVLLLGMFGWWAGQFLWIGQNQADTAWILTVLILTLFSTTFYANTFALQNYNVLGWLFVPIGIYGWSTGNWTLAALAWLGASLGSITVVFLAGWLSLIYCIQSWSILPVLTILPASIKILTHFSLNSNKGETQKVIRSVAKAIGLSKNNSKYVRKSAMRFGMGKIYLLIIYSQFVVAFAMLNNSFPLLISYAIIIWIINSKIARFADDQSMYMLVLSAATVTIIQSNLHNLILLLSYYLLCSPLPMFAGFPSQRCLTTVPIFRPFDVRPLLRSMKDFFADVHPGQRVLMAFNDPDDEYEKIFDGYRVLLELPLYVANEKNFHFMPDWWGVFECNHKGAPDFWGRSVKDVEKQMKAWNADYVVIYQESGTSLDEKWSAAGFQKVSFFSWTQFEDQLGAVKPYAGPTPDWWLLRKEIICTSGN